MTDAAPAIAIIMGSQSDWATMRQAAETLDALGVPDGIPVRFAAPLGRLEIAAGGEDDQRHLTLATGLALGAYA